MKRASGCIHHVEIVICVLGKLPLPFLEWPIWAVYSTVNGMSVETLAYSRIAYNFMDHTNTRIAIFPTL